MNENKVVETEVVEKKGLMDKMKDKIQKKEVAEEAAVTEKKPHKWLKRIGAGVALAAAGAGLFLLGQKTGKEDDKLIDCEYTEEEIEE